MAMRAPSMRRIGPEMVRQWGWQHQTGASASRVRCMRYVADRTGPETFPSNNIHHAAAAMPCSFLASMSSLPHRKETFVQRNLGTVSNFSPATA